MSGTVVFGAKGEQSAVVLEDARLTALHRVRALGRRIHCDLGAVYKNKPIPLSERGGEGGREPGLREDKAKHGSTTWENSAPSSAWKSKYSMGRYVST